MFNLKTLGFENKALEPYISEKTISFHYNKHHQAYLDNLNKLIVETDFAKLSLEEVILKSFNVSGLEGIFNNAAQVYNHDFYWQSLLTKADNKDPLIPDDFLSLVKKQFASWDNFLLELKNLGMKQFASGWLWLVKDGDSLRIITTANANNPLTSNLKPLLVIDLWEHAYYLDYQNRRADYLDSIINNLIDWSRVSDRFFKN